MFIIEIDENMSLDDVIELAYLLRDSNFKISPNSQSLGGILKLEYIQDFIFVNAFTKCEITENLENIDGIILDLNDELMSFSDIYDNSPEGLMLQENRRLEIEIEIDYYSKIFNTLDEIVSR